MSLTSNRAFSKKWQSNTSNDKEAQTTTGNVYKFRFQPYGFQIYLLPSVNIIAKDISHL